MSDLGVQVKKYEVVASFKEGVIEWQFGFMTDDGKQHHLRVRDGEELPILLELCRSDWTLFFHAATQTFRTGWNMPGGKG